MHTMTSSVEAILKSFCIVNIPDHVIACSGILDKLKEYFGKEENGGGEILKCSVQGRSTILVTLSIGVDGLSKLLNTSHEIDGRAVGLREILLEEPCDVMYTRQPTHQEIVGIRHYLENLGMFPVLSRKPEATEPKLTKTDWRFDGIPSGGEMIIICSFGNVMDPSVKCVPKQFRQPVANDVSESDIPHKELGLILDKVRGVKMYSVIYVCQDLPGMQMSRHYYLDKVKQLLEECTAPSAVIWYTGHGEKTTGNWVFQDGIISFRDIYALYFDHFRSKPLTIVSDCSYSGSWVKECSSAMDELGIPSCGHHTREAGLLLKVYCSCKENQTALPFVFCQEAVSTDDHKQYLYYASKKIGAWQDTQITSFITIRCSKQPTERCEIPALHSWEDRLSDPELLQLVRGSDRGRPAWHYVRVHSQKFNEFKERTSSGQETINASDFGRVVMSGFGKDPPDDKKHKVELQFSSLL